MAETIVFSRPAGGHLFHVRMQHGNRRDFMALCGFAPGSAYTNSRRGHWGLTNPKELVPSRVCPKCAKKLQSLPTQESFA